MPWSMVQVASKSSYRGDRIEPHAIATATWDAGSAEESGVDAGARAAGSSDSATAARMSRGEFVPQAGRGLTSRYGERIVDREVMLVIRAAADVLRRISNSTK